MGLFSSKKKIHVDTAVVRIVDDAFVPNSVLAGSLEALFTNKSIPEAIMNSMANSPMRNFEKMYRYAQTGDYFYGLPNARILNSSSGAPQVKAAIEAELSQAITLDYAYFRPINNYHMGWKALIETYGYNPATNVITGLNASVGYTVYLKDLIAVYNIDSLADAEATAIGTWGKSASTSNNPIKGLVSTIAANNISNLFKEESVRYGASETESVEIVYTWVIPAVKNGMGVVTTPESVQEATIVISLASYDSDKEYYQARYTYTSGGGEIVGYWVYDPDTGSHTTLNSVFALNYTDPGTYFPFAVLRREKQNRAAPGMESTPEYLTTKKLLEFINIDYQEFSDKVHESPDIADVEQAVIMMGVPINTGHQIEMDYLMRFFKNLEDITPFGPNNTIGSLSSLSSGQDQSHAIEIADADFRVIISYENIEVRLRAGNVAEPGKFTNTLETLNTGGVQAITEKSVRVFKKQINAHLYEEVRVTNPMTRYDIYQGKSVIGAADDDRLLVPLDYSITSAMTSNDREVLYFRSLHLVANSMVVEKIKWYQSSWFRAILIIVAAVITFLTWGKSWKVLVAAWGVGVGAFAIALVQILLPIIVSSVVVPVIAQEVASLLGPELTAILAAAALVYGGYKGFQAGEIAINSKADVFLKLSSGLSSGVSRHMQELFKDLLADAAQFIEHSELMQADLKEAKDLLGNPLNLNPMLFVNQTPLVVIGETPSEFYSRTVHSGNVGTLSFEIVEKFVEVSLKLPEVHESIRGASYG